MTIRNAASFALAVLRLNALTRAEERAKNPEFKTLWANKRKEYVKVLQQGSSYDELSGEPICMKH
jgi:hypothetical protein